MQPEPSELERQRPDRVLQESEERLRLFVENVPAAIAMFDREMRYIAASRLWRTQYLNGRECLGQNHYEVFPECPEQWRAAHRKGLSGEIVRVEEDVGRRADGAELWEQYEVQPWQTADGDTGGIIIFIADITGRQHAEAALRESEDRLTRAEVLAQTGNWSADLITNQLVWSKGVFRIFGKPEEFQPTFEGWLASVLPHDVDHVRQWCAQCLADKCAYPIEFQITRADGELRTLTSTAELVVGNGGLPVRIFGTIQDITESRHAQQELFAVQKLESLGTLASGIAHDFSNLLGGVLTQAETALAEVMAGESPVEELNAICTTATRGTEIVRQLLVYAGEDTTAANLVNVSQVIADMFDLLRISVSKRVVLEVNLGHDLPPIRASAAQLQRVVMNLVTNASEAIGNHSGVIRVITRKMRRDTASPGDLPHGDCLQLEVSDTGSGMPLELQARVFDPFFTTKSAGHGLGLAVVRGIVQGLDGSIEVSSKPGHGTSFVITIPCSSVDAVAADHTVSTSNDPTPARQNATLLVVEDEESLRKAIVKLLRKEAFEVIEAADGSAAIDALQTKEHCFDLVLLDMTLPGQSSHDVVREVERTLPGAAVLLTSAYGEEFVREKLSSPQIRGYIRKPFRFATLLHSIRTALRPEDQPLQS